MAIPGKYNTLQITKIVDFGVYLDGGELGEILLPMKWVPDNCKPNDELEVFIYFDSSDRLIATTFKPHAVVGEFAYLKVNAVNQVGAFLDWGLDKELLLPYREQKYRVEANKHYVVYIFSDDRGRIAASTQLQRFIDNDTSTLNVGEEVGLLLYAATDLGFKAIINNRFEGMIYANEVFQNLSEGEKLVGYIKQIRDDHKVDLSLYKSGYINKIDDHSEKILLELERNHGFLPLNDKSSPEEIYVSLGMSKKNFKQAIGNLFKLKQINIGDSGINKVPDKQ
jgi:predicted RNA-binding protein (virulence factor B family)